ANYAPLPLPNHQDSGVAGANAQVMVTYDVATHQITRSDASGAQLAPYPTEGHVAGTEGIGPPASNSGSLVPSQSFSPLSLVPNPSDYPWRVNVQVNITFPDGMTYGGSGALIDATHVITAGHVVFDPDHGGFADSIEVVPAYDRGSEPYGSAF